MSYQGSGSNDRVCKNNNAPLLLDPFEGDNNRWYGDATDLTLRDLSSFLGEDYEQFSSLSYTDLENRLLSVANINGTSDWTVPRIRRIMHSRTTVSIASSPKTVRSKRSFVRRFPLRLASDRVRSSDQPGSLTLIWDCAIINHPLELAKRLTEDRLTVKRNLFQKYVLYNWRHELKVYAKLGCWAPNIVPQALRHEYDQVASSEKNSPESPRATANPHSSNVTPTPCLQTNPTKRFLHKFGGLHEFYKSLRDDQISWDDLKMAIHLCPFGLSIGIKRSQKNLDLNVFRRSRSRRRPTMMTTNVSDLHRLLSMQNKLHTSRMASLFELKQLINTKLLVELLTFKPISSYQSVMDSTALIDSHTTDTQWTVMDPVTTEDTDKISMQSATLDFASCAEDEEDEDDEGKDDEANSIRSQSIIGYEGPYARLDTLLTQSGLSQSIAPEGPNTGGRTTRSLSELTQSSELSSLRTLIYMDLNADDLGQEDMLKPITVDSSFPKQNDGASGQEEIKSSGLSSEPRRRQKKIVSVIRPPVRNTILAKMGNLSQIENMTEKRSLSVVQQLRHKVTLPELKERVSVRTMVKGMMDSMTKHAHHSQGPHCAGVKNDMISQVLEMTTRQQPAITRILRERNTRLASDLQRLSKSQLSDMVPDRMVLRLNEQGNRYLLPTLVPVRPPSGQDQFGPKMGLVEISSLSEPIRGGGLLRVAKFGETLAHRGTHCLSPRMSLCSEPQCEPACPYTLGLDPAAKKTSISLNPTEDPRDGTVPVCRSQTLSRTTFETCAQNDGETQAHVFMLPPLEPKPRNILIAVRKELNQASPFILDYFLQTLHQVIPDEKWLLERNSSKLAMGLERLAADLLLYRHSSGHVIRFKLMSIIAASENNRILRRQLRQSAGLQGNWLDQLLRTLSSVQASCRMEAALALARLVTETRLMQQILNDPKHNVVADMLHSIFRAADYYPTSWPEFYMAIAFLLHYNQRQRVFECLIDRTVQTGSARAASLWPKLISLIFTYWRKATLEQIPVNETRICTLLDNAVAHPITRKGAKEAMAAISEYHVLNSKLFSYWTPNRHQKSCEVSGSLSDGLTS